MHVGFPKATPVMTVVHNGVTHQVRVEPGPDGRERFQSMIRKIFNLGEEDAIQLTFGCRVPGAGRVIEWPWMITVVQGSQSLTSTTALFQ